jgi:hypothetical protein
VRTGELVAVVRLLEHEPQEVEGRSITASLRLLAVTPRGPFSAEPFDGRRVRFERRGPCLIERDAPLSLLGEEDSENAGVVHSALIASTTPDHDVGREDGEPPPAPKRLVLARRKATDEQRKSEEMEHRASH